MKSVLFRLCIMYVMKIVLLYTQLNNKQPITSLHSYHVTVQYPCTVFIGR